MSYSSIQNQALSYYNNHFIGSCFSKNLEIMGCKSCLVTKRFGDVDDFGFKDKENCILYENMKDFIEKFNYYITNKEELNKIIDNGYKLVHKNILLLNI